MYKIKNYHQFEGNLGKRKKWSLGTKLGYPGILLGTLGYLIFFENIFTINLISFDEKFKLSPKKVSGAVLFL